MEYRITALQQQKKNKNRINVYLDQTFAFSLDINAALLLYKGRMLSGEEVQQLRNDDRRRKAYQQAIRFLAIRNRSRMEMQRYLEKKDHGTELIQLTIERLVQENYINDLDFACQWIENRERSNPRGMYALRHELRQKGVEEPVIDEALVDVDEVASAWKAVQKRLYRWQGLDKINFQKKAGGFLNRRGFPSGVIHDTLEQAWEALKNDE